MVMIYYEAFKEDFDKIRRQMELQYEELAQYAVKNFIVPIEVRRPEVGQWHEDSDELSVSSIVVAGIKTLARDLEDLPISFWQDFIVVYNGIEKAKVVEGKMIEGSPQKMVSIPDQYQEQVDRIALYSRDMNIRVPYILRSGKGSMQIVSLIGVYYTSNYLLEG